MKTLPLVIVYVLYPIVNTLFRMAGYNINHNWIDVIWGILFAITLFYVLMRRRLALNRPFLIVLSLFMVWVYAHLYYNLSSSQVEFVPMIMELKPFFYALFAWLWVSIWGMPKGRSFVNGGIVLSLILFTEFIVESLAAGQVVRVRGSGEVNYDATLLVMTSCFLIVQGNFWSKKTFWRWIVVLLGLFVTLSRTALVTEVFIWFIFLNVNLIIKAGVIVTAMAAISLSFQMRGLPFMFESMDRYWMWSAAFTLFLNNPLQSLLGFGVQPLPIDIPVQLAYLWVNLQQIGWGLSGIYAYNFHAFWLRFATSWGVIGIFIILLFLAYLLKNYRSSKLVMSLIVVFILQGLTMGMVYMSNIGIPFILAMMVGISIAGRRSLRGGSG